MYNILSYSSCSQLNLEINMSRAEIRHNGLTLTWHKEVAETPLGKISWENQSVIEEELTPKLSSRRIWSRSKAKAAIAGVKLPLFYTGHKEGLKKKCTLQCHRLSRFSGRGNIHLEQVQRESDVWLRAIILINHTVWGGTAAKNEKQKSPGHSHPPVQWAQILPRAIQH